MAKTAPLGLRVEPEMKEALERAARAEDRSVSYLVDRVMRQWLVQQGHLKPPEPQ